MADNNILQTLLYPDAQVESSAIQRQQALADMLRQQSFQPQQEQVINGLLMPTSNIAGFSRLGQGLMASDMQGGINDRQMALNQKMAAQLRAQLGEDGPVAAPAGLTAAPPDMGMGGGATGLTADGVTAPVVSPVAPVSNKYGLANLLKSSLINQAGGAPAASAYWDDQKRTDFQKELGLLPEALRAPALQQKMLPPIVGRAGAGIFEYGKDGSLKLNPVSTQAITDLKTAAAPFEPMRTINAEGGSSVQLTEPEYLSWQKTGNLPARLIPQGVSDNAQVQANTTGAQQNVSITTPGVGVARSSVAPRIGFTQGTEAAATAGAAGKNREEEFSKRWSALQESNSNAQATNSYLESISKLAEKANSGSASDKWAFVNGLIAPFGNERADSELAAKNLMDKYSNQITARLGSGGMATDSARSIIQSAYPNSKMQPSAVHEAVDNLIGANNMIKAKMNFLKSEGINRNSSGFAQKEIMFDQLADPRIWQMRSMTPDAQAKFVGEMSPDVAKDFLQRYQGLKQLGAF